MGIELQFACKCGQKVAADAKRCYYCGFVFGNFAAPAAQAPRVQVKATAACSLMPHEKELIRMSISQVLENFGCTLDSLSVLEPGAPSSLRALPTPAAGAGSPPKPMWGEWFAGFPLRQVFGNDP